MGLVQVSEATAVLLGSEAAGFITELSGPGEHNGYKHIFWKLILAEVAW